MSRVNKFFAYEMTFSALAAVTGTDTKNFQVNSAYDFYWFKSAAFIYDANGLGVSTLQWPNMEVELKDGSTTEQTTNQAAAIHSLFGSGQIPYILPQPHMIAAGASFFAQVWNLHGATAYSVRLCFQGVHVFKGEPLNARAAQAAMQGPVRRPVMRAQGR